MKVLCKKTLYWHQEKGYSGTLNDQPEMNNKPGDPVLQAGKEYETVAIPINQQNGLNYIEVYAIGENSKAYCILHDELHYNMTGLALEHFDFASLKIPVRE
jgi:hypothetical protein